MFVVNVIYADQFTTYILDLLLIISRIEVIVEYNNFISTQIFKKLVKLVFFF